MAKKRTAKKSTNRNEKSSKKRQYLSQTDVPSLTLEQALRIPRAISENYASEPVTPLQLASALNMTPTSGPFRTLCGTSIAYELTQGGYSANEITITDLAKRIIKPLEEGDDIIAKRESTLKPRILNEFLNKYNGSSLPRHDIALNVLEGMGVPSNKTESVYTMILDSAQSVGLLREIKNKQFVDLTGVEQLSSNSDDTKSKEVENEVSRLEREAEIVNEEADKTLDESDEKNIVHANRRVFITHGKNMNFIEPIKKLLGFGELIPVVSVEKQSVSKPVPDKVMDDMRTCGAAIIHVEDEMKLIDQEAKEYTIINSNVLIEIGAAMALFGRRFILLVKEGVSLPSNLQGLYEVRYDGDTLDGNATIKLLEAINDIKNNPLPNRQKSNA